MNKILLPAVWALSFLTLVALATLLSGESSHFYGIADDQEQTISFEQPVEIVRTLVVEGEEVQQGDLLMEVHRISLNSSLAIIDEELQELESRNTEETETLRSRLVTLKSTQEAQRTVIDNQIQKLQSRYDLNRNLVKQLDDRNNQDNLAAPQISPILDEIIGLRKQRHHMMTAVQAEIDNIEFQLNVSERPIYAQISALKEKRSELVRQMTNFRIYAIFSGRVGSILFKPGETISPYQPILTVHSSNPSYVKAYINENVLNRVKLNQTVWVQSSTQQSTDTVIAAKVESLGSRIVEYPERLKKNPLVAAWGREVVVRLSDTHALLMGEKVIVQLNEPVSLLNAISSGSSAVATKVTNFMSTNATSAFTNKGSDLLKEDATSSRNILLNHDVKKNSIPNVKQ